MTVGTLKASADAVVIRHSQDEYFKELEDIQIPILNAGRWLQESSTQCLLDLLTIYQEFQTFQGIKRWRSLVTLHIPVLQTASRKHLVCWGRVAFSVDEWVAKDAYYKRVDEAVQWMLL